jgi:uncharacterized protein YkwD
VIRFGGRVTCSVVLLTLLCGCPNGLLLDSIEGPASEVGSASGASTSLRAPASDSPSPDSALDPDFEASLARFPECSEPPRLLQWRDEILRLVNEERAARGLGQLRRNETLEQQATTYACEMIQYDFFDHVNPVTGSTLGERALEFGYTFRVVGENLAAGQSTPREAFQDWMNSRAHRDNILEPRFTELGVGIRRGGAYGFYWVQEFGLPMESVSRTQP